MKNKIVIEIPSKREELEKIANEVQKIAYDIGFAEDEIDNISIGVTEAVNNAIIHGNKLNEDKKVKIVFTIFEDSLKIEVTDQGAGFELNLIENPLEPENLLKENGRGIFILRAVMDKVDFKMSDKGTKVTMLKYKKDEIQE